MDANNKERRFSETFIIQLQLFSANFKFVF